MSDTLIIKIAEGHDYKKLHSLYWKYEAEYCEKWDIDYWLHGSKIFPWSYYTGEQENLKSWGKFELIAAAFRQGYKRVAYMDTDSLIVDPNTDIRWAFSGTCSMVRWWSGQATSHLQAGNMYIENNPDSGRVGLQFVIYLMQEAKYYQARLPTLRGWLEQGQIAEMELVSETRKMLSAIDYRWNWCPNFCEPIVNPVVRSFHSMRGDRLLRQVQKVIRIYYEGSEEIDDGKIEGE